MMRSIAAVLVVLSLASPSLAQNPSKTDRTRPLWFPVEDLQWDHYTHKYITSPFYVNQLNPKDGGGLTVEFVNGIEETVKVWTVGTASLIGQQPGETEGELKAVLIGKGQKVRVSTRFGQIFLVTVGEAGLGSVEAYKSMRRNRRTVYLPEKTQIYLYMVPVVQPLNRLPGPPGRTRFGSILPQPKGIQITLFSTPAQLSTPGRLGTFQDKRGWFTYTKPHPTGTASGRFDCLGSGYYNEGNFAIDRFVIRNVNGRTERFRQSTALSRPATYAGGIGRVWLETRTVTELGGNPSRTAYMYWTEIERTREKIVLQNPSTWARVELSTRHAKYFPHGLRGLTTPNWEVTGRFWPLLDLPPDPFSGFRCE